MWTNISTSSRTLAQLVFDFQIHIDVFLSPFYAGLASCPKRSGKQRFAAEANSRSKYHREEEYD